MSDPTTPRDDLDGLTAEAEGSPHRVEVADEEQVAARAEVVSRELKYRLEVRYEDLGRQLTSLQAKDLPAFFAEFDPIEFQTYYLRLTEGKVKLDEVSEEVAKLVGLNQARLEIGVVQQRLDRLIQQAEPSVASAETRVKAHAESFVGFIRKIKENLE